MKTTKIQISPAMREFNEAVETADALTDFRFDKESAQGLLQRLSEEGCYAFNVEGLRQSIQAMAVKQ